MSKPVMTSEIWSAVRDAFVERRKIPDESQSETNPRLSVKMLLSAVGSIYAKAARHFQDQIGEHEALCRKYAPRLADICIAPQPTLPMLNRSQQNAIAYVEKLAITNHFRSMERLEAKLQGVPGYTKSDVFKSLVYIKEEAPVIIHLTGSTLGRLVKDTHYRNCFETGQTASAYNPTRGSYMNMRRLWERNMSGGAYSGAEAFDRPKYGCLNITGDIRGCPSARSYGEFFLILKPSIRQRCTLWYGNHSDKNDKSVELGTFDYYAHRLLRYSTKELASVMKASKSVQYRAEVSEASRHKEVHIHGPIKLYTDIEALSIPAKEETASKQLKELVLRFQKKTKCHLLWQDDF